MKNNNRLTSLMAALMVCLSGWLPGCALGQTENHDNYAFMSAQDLYDALSQQSEIALGYLLGIVDARKGSQPSGGCFTVPWRADADIVLVETYLEYWPQVADFSMTAPDALIQMMQLRFPCKPK
jgi:hypothetical protein